MRLQRIRNYSFSMRLIDNVVFAMPNADTTEYCSIEFDYLFCIIGIIQ
jgi:hypothetical protein